MSRRFLPALLVLLLSEALTASQPKREVSARLNEFYIVRQAISDAGPHWFEYILDVSPDKDGTTIKYIRIAPLNPWCADSVTIKAAIAHLKDTSPKEVVGTDDPCLLGLDEFRQALDDSRRGKAVSLDDTALWNVVASCSTGEKEFHFPYPEEVKMNRIKRRSPRVMALWDLEPKITKIAFGEKSVFYHIPSEKDMELQRLGQELLPELRSGRFDKGFQGYCVELGTHGTASEVLWSPISKPCSPHPMEDLLSGYHGPVPNREPAPQLLNPEELHFLKFELPEFPPLARMAKIQGKVELSLEVDQQTGEVKNTTVVSGHPLLAKSAEAAAQRWRFDPGAQATNHPIRVILDYAFHCP